MTKWIRRFLFRALVSLDRVRSVRGSSGLPEKEPWIKWHLFQRPRYQTTNKSNITTVDKVFLASCWWNELSFIEICKLKCRLSSFCKQKLYCEECTQVPSLSATFCFCVLINPLYNGAFIKCMSGWTGMNRPFALRGMWRRFYENESYMILPSKND